ncbi:glycosyltransferase [Pelagibacterales bacterium]|nr:glycosyltransferase [Pelagibacterales bacterium]|tara:strand:- start:640 stop:1773 length:1134 start_codon:yes stop_codon:yes gene_type:complete
MNQKKVILVYRDKLLLDSETFISRSYEAFSDYRVVYACSKLGWSHNKIKDEKIIVSNGVVSRFLFTNFGFIKNLKQIKQLKPSIVHAHFGKSGALALPIAQQLKIPLIITYHGGDITKSTHLKKTILPKVYQRRLAKIKKYASNFFGVSNFISQKLIDNGFSPDKVVTHYLGINLKKTNKSDRFNDRLFFAGRFVEKKGIDILIDAIKILNSKGHLINLDLAGTGPLEDYFKKMTKDMPQIKYLGWLSKEEMDNYMTNSMAVVVPSKVASNGDCEGLPTVILEAFSNSCLVIASNHSGIPEIIKSEETGFIFKECDSEALSKQILKVRDISLHDRNKLIDAGQKILIEKFNSFEQSKKLEKNINKILSNEPIKEANI